MGMFVDGKWQVDQLGPNPDGRFVRKETSFRDWVTAEGASGFKAEAGRYHLYVSLACPWAHRTLIMRSLKKLHDTVSISIVDFHNGEEGWHFSENPGAIPDTINGKKFLREIYLKARGDFTGRVTVPVLWDRVKQTIVNNESREIMRMLDTEFEAFAAPGVHFLPPDLREKVDQTLDAIYQPINNGVYRAGFAGNQAAYEDAVTELFKALDHWEGVLGHQRFLCGNVPTEADWAMFTTLVRFDAVYFTHFKCNLRRISAYPNLGNYLKDLYQTPGVAETCNFDHIKGHYYGSQPTLNPRGIVPLGPELSLEGAHGRAEKFAN